MTVDISAIPELVGDALTISTFGGELLCSTAVILTAIIITAIFTRDTFPLIVASLMGVTICISLGWLDYWFLILLSLLVALLYANKITKMLSGSD